MATHECAYCNADVAEAPVPPASDDAGWSALASTHAEDCEWIATRAHRIVEAAKRYIAVAGQDAGSCEALRWAWASIRPYVLATGDDEDDVRARAEQAAGHDDIHVEAC